MGDDTHTAVVSSSMRFESGENRFLFFFFFFACEFDKLFATRFLVLIVERVEKYKNVFQEFIIA